ncbi:MAG: FkbM family methyltransferase [Steroidobacteraceae bacterium]
MSALGSAKRALLAPLRLLDIAVIRQSSLNNLRGHAKDLREKLRELSRKSFIEAMPADQRERLSGLLPASRSQICQDLLVLSELDFRRDGYFVEFGACDGRVISNTHLLEQQFGWRGILAEPCRSWHSELKAGRRAHISTKCVWSRSGEKLEFMQAPQAVISTIAAFSDADKLSTRRKHGRSYEVETISLADLLAQYQAPREIDYLSADTEGSEFNILSALDFSKYRFRVITVEHGYRGDARQNLYALLSSHGYTRKYQQISQMDDWYVSSN